MENALKYIFIAVLLFNFSINGSSMSKDDSQRALVECIPDIMYGLETLKITNVLPCLNDYGVKEIKDAVLKATRDKFDRHYDIHAFYKTQNESLRDFLKNMCCAQAVTEKDSKEFSGYLEDKHYGRLVLIILTSQLECLCELYEQLYDKFKNKYKLKIDPETLNDKKDKYLALLIHRQNH